MFRTFCQRGRIVAHRGAGSRAEQARTRGLSQALSSRQGDHNAQSAKVGRTFLGQCAAIGLHDINRDRESQTHPVDRRIEPPAGPHRLWNIGLGNARPVVLYLQQRVVCHRTGSQADTALRPL